MVRLSYFGGPAWDDRPVPAHGRGQEAVLFRLAVDTGTVVGYRALAEDVWPTDPPADPRAALQSLVSRLRRALPPATIEAASGGYRLMLRRDEVDLTLFQDLVARARRDADPSTARAALALWTGDPWTPDGFDWVTRDLLEDRAHAEHLTRPGPQPTPPTTPLPISPPDAPTGAPLPAAITPLIGRQDELGLIARQLADERLVTVLGPGGAGKTTLALETARRHPGSVLVELAPASNGEVWSAVASAVARSIRFDTSSAPAGARERALEALAGRTALIVLDNCEHVAREAAEVARDLLGSVPTARLLATSREPLGLPGEAFVDLGPLPEPDAVELFTRRIRAARGTAPADDESDVVTRIVRSLDGLPLALELAAAKTRTLSLAEVDAGLADRFTLLAAGPRAADPRHQTLRALIDWSWETLSPAERTGMLALSVFPDGLLASDAAVIAREFDTVGDAFDQLVDRSLAHRHDGRFRMLETVREYGLERLRHGAAGEATDADESSAHPRLDDFISRRDRALAELALAHDALLRGPRVREGLAWFTANEENLSAALRSAISTPEVYPTGIRLTRGALWAWLMHERFEELQTAVTSLVRTDPRLDSEAEVVVQGVALLATTLSSVAAAEETEVSDDPSEQAAARYEAQAAAHADAFRRRAERLIAAAAAYRSELSAALPPLLTAIDGVLRTHRPGAPWTHRVDVGAAAADAPVWTVAFLSMLRSAIAQNSGDVETLGAQSERALTLFQELGDVWGIAFSSQMRAEWLLLQGRPDEALQVADASTAGLAGLTSTADLLQQRTQGLNALVRLERWDEARARLADVRVLAEAEGSERARLHVAFAAASLELAAGDGTAALGELGRVDVLGLDESVPPQAQAWDAGIRTQAHLLRGELADARVSLRVGLAAALRSGDQPILADVAVSLAWWLSAAGLPERAREAARASAQVRGTVDATDPAWRRLVKQLGGLEVAMADARSDHAARVDAAIATLERLGAELDH